MSVQLLLQAGHAGQDASRTGPSSPATFRGVEVDDLLDSHELVEERVD